MKDYWKIAVKYATEIVNGKIPACLYTIQACKRFLGDINSKKYTIRKGRVSEVCRFVESLYLNDQEKDDIPFRLSPFQVFFIANIYGFYKDGKRRFKYAYFEIARKNGKSELIAALAMYHLLFDRNAFVTVSANSREQAKNTDFRKVKNFCHQIDPYEAELIPYFNSIEFNTNKLVVTSADASRLDGLNCSFAIIDELHSSRSGDVYNVIKSSMGSREEPLLIVITTAGFDTDSFCYKLRNYITEILAGTVQDDAQFGIIYTLDEGDSIDDDSVWVKANPNLGISVYPDFIQSEVNKAKNSPSETAGVKVKHFNLWLSKTGKWVEWLPQAKVSDALVKVDFSDPYFSNFEIYCGIDLASTSDIAAVSYCCLVDGIYHFYNKYYLPEDSLNSAENKKLYKQYAEQGYITLTPGNVTDYDYILKDILEMHSKHFIRKIRYDKYNATQFAIAATEAGLNLLPFAQTIFNYNAPTKEFERAVLSGKIKIDANPITHWMLSNVAIKTDGNGNIKPIKGAGDSRKIDGVPAMIMALSGYLNIDVGVDVY